MDGTHLNGTVSELKAQLYYTDLGYQIFTPIQPQAKTDFIATKRSEVIKVQVKSIVEFSSFGRTYLQVKFQGKFGSMYSEDDVDVFCLSYKDNLWIVPFEVFKGKKSATIGKLVDGNIIDSIQKGVMRLSEYKVK